ncbi:MAG: YeeE/YedE thiosulfate transporter family protein [bacterium]
MNTNSKAERYMNPYVAGVLLGVVLFASFMLFGHGLGASGGIAQFTAALVDKIWPGHADQNAYLAGLVRTGAPPLDTWLIFEVVGIILGGFVSGLLAGRVKLETYKGPHINNRTRWAYALIGGIIAGFAVRISRGCTSGQALSGGASLSAGSWAFMFAVFGGAYAFAYFVRKLWN